MRKLQQQAKAAAGSTTEAMAEDSQTVTELIDDDGDTAMADTTPTPMQTSSKVDANNFWNQQKGLSAHGGKDTALSGGASAAGPSGLSSSKKFFPSLKLSGMNLDSGATIPISNIRNLFTDVQPANGHVVTVADNRKLAVDGIGKFHLRMGPFTKVVDDSYFISDWGETLVSVSRLLQGGEDCILFNSKGAYYYDHVHALIYLIALNVNHSYQL
jgi:hypothetical protein